MDDAARKIEAELKELRKPIPQRRSEAAAEPHMHALGETDGTLGFLTPVLCNRMLNVPFVVDLDTAYDLEVIPQDARFALDGLSGRGRRREPE